MYVCMYVYRPALYSHIMWATVHILSLFGCADLML